MTFKAKRAGKSTAHTVMILDGSSSMTSAQEATISGFNEFLEVQKKSSIPTNVTVFMFNGTDVKTIVSNVPAKDVEPLTKYNYSPNGMTNLLDAIGTAIEHVNAQLTALKKEHRPSVEICILTDGEENMSHRFDNRTIREMKKACEDKNWSFTFVGADIDAFAVSGSLGFGSHNTLQYGKLNTGETIAILANRSEFVKTARMSGLDTAQVYASAAFTDAQRSQANKDK